jgi:hypothetical protein
MLNFDEIVLTWREKILVVMYLVSSFSSLVLFYLWMGKRYEVMEVTDEFEMKRKDLLARNKTLEKMAQAYTKRIENEQKRD